MPRVFDEEGKCVAIFEAPMAKREAVASVKIIVTMEHVPTGEVRTYEADNYGPWAEGSEFWWRDGNMSCDCNRADEFARAAGEVDADHGCSDGEFRIISIKSQAGDLLYSEPPA